MTVQDVVNRINTRILQLSPEMQLLYDRGDEDTHHYTYLEGQIEALTTLRDIILDGLGD